MTTLVALASKHAVVVGSDSMGTATRRLVDPMKLLRFFDHDKGFQPRLDGDNALTIAGIYGEAVNVPYNQLLHVDKLFQLGELPAAAMFTGITAIGEETVRGLIAHFAENDEATKQSAPDWTIEALAQRCWFFCGNVMRQRIPRTICGMTWNYW